MLWIYMRIYIEFQAINLHFFFGFVLFLLNNKIMKNEEQSTSTTIPETIALE